MWPSETTYKIFYNIHLFLIPYKLLNAFDYHLTISILSILLQDTEEF